MRKRKPKSPKRQVLKSLSQVAGSPSLGEDPNVVKILEGWRAGPGKSIDPKNLVFPAVGQLLSRIQVWSQTPDIAANINRNPSIDNVEIKLLPVFQSNREISLGESHDKNFLSVSPKKLDLSRAPSADPRNNSITLTLPKTHQTKVKIHF